MTTVCKLPGPGTWQEIGYWLDDNMPNPPLPETQRWTIITESGRIEFEDPQDAVLFQLRWGS